MRHLQCDTQAQGEQRGGSRFWDAQPGGLPDPVEVRVHQDAPAGIAEPAAVALGEGVGPDQVPHWPCRDTRAGPPDSAAWKPRHGPRDGMKPV